MTTKLSKTQQEIVDAMRKGAYLGISRSRKEYELFDASGKRIQKITYGTFGSLRDKKVIQHSGIDERNRMLRYVLTDAYKEQS